MRKENPYFRALEGEPVKMADIIASNPHLYITVEQLIKMDSLAAQYSLEGELFIYRPRAVIDRILRGDHG